LTFHTQATFASGAAVEYDTHRSLYAVTGVSSSDVAASVSADAGTTRASKPASSVGPTCQAVVIEYEVLAGFVVPSLFQSHGRPSPYPPSGLRSERIRRSQPRVRSSSQPHFHAAYDASPGRSRASTCALSPKLSSTWTESAASAYARSASSAHAAVGAACNGAAKSASATTTCDRDIPDLPVRTVTITPQSGDHTASFPPDGVSTSAWRPTSYR
jgi:hypothetical protein